MTARELPELERRRRATQATLDRYRAKQFSWARGITCVHLARAQLKNMGHRPPTLPRFRSALAAKRALADRNWGSVSDMLDQLLLPIAPAMMRVGDLAVVPGTEGLDSILICAGHPTLLGWHPETGEFVIYDGGFEQLTGAWRV